MSIIQSLRDRAAVLLSVMIAISLIGFLVQDAFIGRSGNLFSGPSTTAGSINGKKIDLVEFNQKVNTAEQSYRAQGLQTNEMMTQSIIENVWNGYIQEALIPRSSDKCSQTETPACMISTQPRIGSTGLKKAPRKKMCAWLPTS
jgi:peptidyl-prolyl cis-trans isomerase D